MSNFLINYKVKNEKDKELISYSKIIYMDTEERKLKDSDYEMILIKKLGLFDEEKKMITYQVLLIEDIKALP